MKYKVGDKVKIREDLIECQQYGKMSFIGSGMVACKGRTAMIDEILDDGRYHINIDPEGFIWTDEMFEEVGDIEKEADNDFTVENVLNHTDVESGGMIIEVFYPTASFKATIGHNRIVRNSELYKRFIKAYGNMIVDEINILCDEHGNKHMRLVVDYKDEE